MYPVVATLFGFHLYGYGLMIGLGIVCGSVYFAFTAKNELGLSYDHSNNLVIYLVVASVLGGKVFLFFEEPASYFHHPLQLISGSGFVFYGSLIFCYGALWWFIKKHALPARPFLDIIAITTCMVHIFGRIGCFMAGCCYGTPAPAAMGVTYTHPLSAAPRNCLLHPVQLYEAAGMSVLVLLLAFTRRHRKFNGQVFALYLVCYPLLRINTEHFRGDTGRGFIAGHFSYAQLVSVMLFVTGCTLYLSWRRRSAAIVVNKQ